MSRLRIEDIPFLAHGPAPPIAHTFAVAPPRAGRMPPHEKDLSSVSVAEPNDLADLLAFLGPLHEEIECDDEILLRDIAGDLVARRYGIAFIVRSRAPDDNKIEASMGLRLDRVKTLSRSYGLHSVWYVVRPDRRTTGHALSLLMTAIQFSEQMARPVHISGPVPPELSGKPAYKVLAKCPKNQSGRPYEPISVFGPKNKMCSRFMGMSQVVFTTLPVIPVV